MLTYTQIYIKIFLAYLVIGGNQMQIDFMRKVDYWFGNLICWFLSCSYGIKQLFKKYKFKEPKKVLFLELSEMGSAVLAYPAMKKVKELWQNTELYFMIFDKNADSVKILNIMPEENIITIRDDNFFIFAYTTLKALLRCRREKIDTFFDLELFSRISAIIAYLSGSNNRIGFYRYNMEGLYRGTMQSHKVSYNPHHHIGVNFLALVYSLKADTNQFPLLKRYISVSELCIPHIKPDNESKQKMWDKMYLLNKNLTKDKILIIVNPHAGILPVRAWPLENYIALCKRLSQDERILIITTGIGEAEDYATEIVKAVGEDKCINLVNKTTFYELITLYSLSHILITNDSGPVHFAPLTSIHVIAFYGPETHKLYGPIGKNISIINSEFVCSPCLSAFNHRKTSCNDNLCLKTISVEDIYNLVKEVLKRE